MKSLRIQRDDLYKAIQESIQFKTNQSFGEGFDNFI